MCTGNRSILILQKESYCLRPKKNLKKKMIGHHDLLRENDDLPLRRAPAIMIFNVRTLITRGIICSKDAQCNTKKLSQKLPFLVLSVNLIIFQIYIFLNSHYLSACNCIDVVRRN